MSEHEILLRPVTSKKEGVILLDIYVNGTWVGSRRTCMACETFLGLNKPKAATNDGR